MNNQNAITNLASRISQSVSLKLATIVFLVLILLIPGGMIRSLISERETMNTSTVHDVSSKWANRQMINGPILTIPLRYQKMENDQSKVYVDNWHILPEQLNIDGKVEPEKLRRGIYEVVVYHSLLDISGAFKIGEKPQDKNLIAIEWEKAFLTIGISDLRGIQDELKVNLNGQSLPVSPGTKISGTATSGVTVPYPISETSGTLQYNFQLAMQGSKNLSFTPIGSKTNVKLSSSWSSPSFDGHFLPDSREVNEEGFVANWKVLQLNRNFPQSWVGTAFNLALEQTAFGVNLMLPLDDYQKSMRSAKYAVMTIGLTFLLFFLVEILNKQRIHAFQYTLVGLGLCLFYVLLISISEHSSFNTAYGIATFAISSMITLYAHSIFKSRKMTIALASLILAVYGFVFVTLQLTDFALLLGSIGLTVTLAATMYFTRNINWYNISETKIKTT